VKLKNEEIPDIATQINELQSKIDELQKQISIVESELEQNQDDLYEKDNELIDLKKGILFQIASKISKGLDKIFPPNSKIGKGVKILQISFFTLRNEGFRILFNEFTRKLRIQFSIFQKKSFSEIDLSFLGVDEINLDQENPNVIYSHKKIKPEINLRKFLQHDSTNILNLPQFPKVSIIILTLDKLDLLKRNITKIQSKTTYKNYEIIIITNNQDENSEMRTFLKESKHQYFLYHEEYSFSGMNNFGAKKANGEVLLFLNDDVEVLSPYWLESLLKLVLDDKVGAAGPKLLFPNKTLQEAGCIVWKDGIAWNYGRNDSPLKPQYNFVRNVDYCSAACLMIKKEIFENMNGFDTTYHPAYSEDVDLCLSLQKFGYKILYQPLATLIHHEGSTQGTILKSGIKSYQVKNQKKLKKKWNDYLSKRAHTSWDNINLERTRNAGINILYIDHHVPEYDKDAGSLMIFYSLSILSHMKNNVTFWPHDLRKNEPYTGNLQQRGIEVMYGPERFANFIRKRGKEFQLCIISRPHITTKFIDSIKKHAPQCKIAYQTMDLHHIRELRDAVLSEDRKKLVESELSKKTELDIVKKSDMTIVVSMTEANTLLKENPSIDCTIIPPMQITIDETSPYSKRKDLLFLGGFQHEPNIDSLKNLVTDIFPKILEKIPDVTLYVIGSNPPQKIIDLCKDVQNVEFLGYVKNIDPYLDKCRLLLAPLRYGAGVKGKITQSMAHGLVTITTKIGSEGISNKNNEVLMIAKNNEEFIEKAVFTYNDKEIWTKISQNAKEHVEEFFSPENVKEAFTQMIFKLLKPKIKT